MTGVVAVFLAVVAGMTVSTRWRVTLVVVVPFLAVLGVQTWSLATGRGSSPPSTVQYPGLFSYYLVQLVILALALVAADQLRIWRLRRSGSRSVDGERETRLALACNGVVSVIVAVGFYFGNGRLHVRPHHGTSNPPAAAALCMLAAVVVLVVFGLLNLVARRRAGRGAAVMSG